MKNVPEYVKYIGDGEAGLKKGDIVKVLCGGSVNSLYVESPRDGGYCGDAAQNPASLDDKKFAYINSSEYEIIEEKKKVENNPSHKFKVGDIVCGNNGSRYGITNSSMTRGKVVEVDSGGSISVKILEHKWYSDNFKKFSYLDPKYFDLVEDKPKTTETTTPDVYHITTDMKTFVDIEHNGNKGWSKCDLRYDKFDLETGIDIAMDRLDEVENPPKKELPKYVRYIGNRNPSIGGLVKGDICRVLSGVIKGEALYFDTLFVACPNPTPFNGGCASNPSALKGHNFDYLYPHEYEVVNIHE